MEEGIISMAQGERQIGEGCDQFVTSDVFGDIFGRVDGATLARLSSVNTQFRSAALDEAHWENLCNQRWPSTKQPTVKRLISSAGGFRKFYRNCFPVVTPRRGRVKHHEVSTSAADFISLVDVACRGERVLSRVVDGINGAEALCGPLVDVVETTWEGDYGVPMNPEEEDGPLASIDTKHLPRKPERSDRQRLWRTLRHQMRVSWILIHKKTNQMVNLSSWKPLTGMRHCGYGDDDIILCFGTVLPNPGSTPVLCNILMRCKTCEPEEEELHPETPAMTVVKVTELGFTLEAGDGVHLLRRQEAVNVLSRAMSCHKTIDHSKVARIYHKFIATQKSNREALLRRENHRQTAIAICFVGTIVYILISYCYKPSCWSR